MSFYSKVAGYLIIGSIIVIRSGLVGTKIYDTNSYERSSKTKIISITLRDYLFFETLKVVSQGTVLVDKCIFSLFPLDIALPRRRLVDLPES